MPKHFNKYTVSSYVVISKLAINGDKWLLFLKKTGALSGCANVSLQ